MPTLSPLDVIHGAWTALLIGWTLILIREHREVRRLRAALRAATLEALFRVRCLPPVARGPEDRPANARGDQ